MDWTLLFHTLLGTALVAGGAAALNQLLEREHDAKMERTEDRPLPSGRLQPETVLIFGGMISSRRPWLSRVESKFADQHFGNCDACQLSLHLYTAETSHFVEHSNRRDSRRVAAVDGMDSSAK